MDTLVTPRSRQDKPKKKLFDQVRDTMRVKHYSLRTELEFRQARRAWCEYLKYSGDAKRGTLISACHSMVCLSNLLTIFQNVDGREDRNLPGRDGDSSRQEIDLRVIPVEARMRS